MHAMLWKFLEPLNKLKVWCLHGVARKHHACTPCEIQHGEQLVDGISLLLKLNIYLTLGL
jgi:hypothetical protein